MPLLITTIFSLMIRKANDSDCVNLAALSLQVWLQTYCIDGIRTENSRFALSTFTADHFKKLLRDPDRRLLVYTEGIFLRGYIQFNLHSYYKTRESGFEIEKLYVQEPLQRQGIGRALLEQTKKDYGRCFWLYTWFRNNAIEFYTSYGFEDKGQYNFTLGSDTIKNRVLVYKDIK